MVFRPLPVLTLLTLPALGLLIGLGTWQLSRMDDKAAAIAVYEAANRIAPVSLESALCSADGIALGRRVERPETLGDRTVRYFGRDAGDAAGWRLFRAAATPLCGEAETGSALLVESGFLALDGIRTEYDGLLTLAATPGRGIFDAQNDPAAGDFHNYDAREMAAALGVPDVSSQIWLVARSAELPPHLAQTPPSRHLGYALTWFGFALTLLGVYIAFHVSKGRLGFTRR